MIPEENMPNQEQHQRFCFLSSIFKGKSSEPIINLDISVEILIFLGNTFGYSLLNCIIFYLSMTVA